MKRKLETQSRVVKKVDAFVSATSTANFLLKNTLVDWLNLYEGKKGEMDVFHKFLMNAGNEFEKYVVSRLPCHKFVSNEITPEACEQVRICMKEKTPIIYSAPFENEKNRTRGIIDLLVREDYISKLFPTCNYIEKPDNSKYVAIDIKFTTLSLRADGKHLLNSGRFPAYKGQLKVYTDFLTSVQGETRNAGILGRRYTYTSKGEVFSGMDIYDRIGWIDYAGVDIEYVALTEKAIEWVRDVRQNGSSWDVYNPHRIEMYPNMNVDSGFSLNKRKREIAMHIKDITLLWNCGIKHRENAFSKGITTWDKASSKILGINGAKSKTIDSIIKVNKTANASMLPAKVKNNMCGWKDVEDEIYLDFETFCDVFDNEVKTNSIFMIGVWDKGEYINFTAKNNSRDEEFRIMTEFVNYYKARNSPKIWFWCAEPKIWETSENFQMDRCCLLGKVEDVDFIVNNFAITNWADLACVFREEPITVKGAFNYGLKEIASAMRELGLINASLSGDVLSGLDAAILAREGLEKGDTSCMKSIEKYNKFDVQVLSEILTFLRSKYI